MSYSERLALALKAARELGIEQVWLYARYQIALRSGWLRRRTPAHQPEDVNNIQAFHLALDLISLPDREILTQIVEDHAAALLAEANDLTHGKVRLFGGPLQDLDLVVPLPLEHWTSVALDPTQVGIEDIKLLWEPARFTWIYPLVRAYHLSGDERYVETFWQHFEAFADINLPNLGPNWVSAQEVAIRLISYTFAIQAFCSAEASTAERMNRISQAIADHAARIPVSLSYARAQNNNHLLSEAAGLITAAAVVPDHPRADTWYKLGWRWFNRALENQITDAGTYIQHSVNYHRLMLNLALWVHSLDSDGISESNQARLAAATRWLLDLIDPDNGRVPNMGHNDGSLIQNLASAAYSDYRPTGQAASIAFLGEPVYSGGPWDEYPVWLGLWRENHKKELIESITPEPIKVVNFPGSHLVMHDQANSTWGSMRAARFTSRPAHADQLHLDLWWREYNLALDPGTYLYNAAPPWENALTHSMHHNTVTINGLDQMTYAGRFLWLDWAQAETLTQTAEEDGKRVIVSAQHDGYHRLGIIHRRTITCESNHTWLIEDHLVSVNNPPNRSGNHNQTPGHGSIPAEAYRARLHWNLPDWSWKIEKDTSYRSTNVQLRSPAGWVNLRTGIESATQDGRDEPQVVTQLIRAGELVHGSGSASPVSGWVSPTYGYRIPALSLAIEIDSPLPIKFTSEWEFPQGS